MEIIRHTRLISRFADRPLESVGPILTVGVMMGTLYVSFVCVCIPAIHSSTLGVSSVLFHTAFGLAIVSYHEGVVTDPGSIPESWTSCPTLSGTEPLERKKTNGRFRFCNKEKKYKPDRAHFCSAMQKNVLRMDHYCPWLSNCVGHKNHKFFFLFLFYTFSATTFADFQMILAMKHGGLSAMGLFMHVQGTILASFVVSALGPFFGFHCWLMSRNLTTIEYCETRGGDNSVVRSRYDAGVVNNFMSVMGDKIYLWPFPCGGPSGDGLSWVLPELAEDVEERQIETGEGQGKNCFTIPGPAIHSGHAASSSQAANSSISGSTDQVATDVFASNGASSSSQPWQGTLDFEQLHSNQSEHASHTHGHLNSSSGDQVAGAGATTASSGQDSAGRLWGFGRSISSAVGSSFLPGALSAFSEIGGDLVGAGCSLADQCRPRKHAPAMRSTVKNGMPETFVPESVRTRQRQGQPRRCP